LLKIVVMMEDTMEENTSGKGDRVDCDLIINNGYLLTMDKDQTSYPDGALAITGNAIVGVGSAKAMNAKFKPRLVMDARGGVVHPGLIDCHYHTGIHLARGAVPEDPSAETPITFYDWFNALEDGDEYVSALASCAEMVSHGYTAFMEPGTTFEPDAVAAAAEAIGIRASVADPFLWDIPEGVNTSVKRAPCDLKRALNLLGKELWRNNDPNSLIRAHVCAYGGGTASGELLLAAKDCADKNGVVLNQHHNFTVEQAEKDDKRFGGRHTLVRFADMGLIDQNCTFVHMNVIRDDEIDPIVKSGMSLVWVPGNYLFYGIASKTPCCMPQLLGKGANVTFGVDTAKIWSFGDMELIVYLAARQNDEYI
jgi:5-methylthioadenosine/S-adenosylhomocysteine deaminase